MKTKSETVLADENNTENGLIHKISDMKHKISESYKENSEKIKDKAAKANENVVKYVKENPKKAIGFGIAAGIILGKLLNRRK